MKREFKCALNILDVIVGFRNIFNLVRVLSACQEIAKSLQSKKKKKKRYIIAFCLSN